MLALIRQAWLTRNRLLVTLGLFTIVTVVYGLLHSLGSPLLVISAPSLHFAHPKPTGLAAIFENHSFMTPAQYRQDVLLPLRGKDQDTADMFAYETVGAAKQSAKSSAAHDICIIDLDNRPFDQPGELFNKTPMATRGHDQDGLSLGALSHWVYAQIHGYKYYYIHVNGFVDRRNSWKKPPVISKLLKNHKTCVYVDTDVIFRYLELPLERLLEHWKIDSTRDAITMAIDPDLDFNKDSFQRTNVNSGFIIAQNTERAHEILKAWEDCPEEGGRYPNCTLFRERRVVNGHLKPSDQGAFSDLIRYDYPDDIKELPCAEANGYPEDNNPDHCHGQWVRHYWNGKDSWLKVAVKRRMPGDLLELFHRHFLQDRPNFFMNETELMTMG